VGDEEDRHPPVRGAPEEAEDGHLVAEVQAGSGFVQDQGRRLLGQCPGDADPLELATGQGCDVPFSKLRHCASAHGLPDGRPITLPLRS
jgi:hypothetical protein